MSESIPCPVLAGEQLTTEPTPEQVTGPATIKTAQRRAEQMQKAAEIEAEHLVWEGTKSKPGINSSALAKKSKTDRKTIDDWRENRSDYRQAVADVLAARIAAKFAEPDGS